MLLQEAPRPPVRRTPASAACPRRPSSAWASSAASRWGDVDSSQAAYTSAAPSSSVARTLPASARASAWAASSVWPWARSSSARTRASASAWRSALSSAETSRGAVACHSLVCGHSGLQLGPGDGPDELVGVPDLQRADRARVGRGQLGVPLGDRPHDLARVGDPGGLPVHRRLADAGQPIRLERGRALGRERAQRLQDPGLRALCLGVGQLPAPGVQCLPQRQADLAGLGTDDLGDPGRPREGLQAALGGSGR